jgi:hypothetical protein
MISFYLKIKILSLYILKVLKSLNLVETEGPQSQVMQFPENNYAFNYLSEWKVSDQK